MVLYMGFPLTDKRPWKARTLAKAGRGTLINATLNAISAYSMSCICLPAKIALTIEATIMNFFWGSEEGKNKFSLSLGIKLVVLRI